MLNNGETEGSPVTFAEAAIYKIPSIGGINSGASTIISHNKTGLIINMKSKSKIKNSIKKLLNNRVLLESMGEAAQKKIMNEHTPEKIGNDFRMLIKTYI
jgi:glycosyltransferase involved in cell wall biosynthesis